MAANVRKNSSVGNAELRRSIEEFGNDDVNYDNLIHGRKFGKGALETDPISKSEPWDGEVDGAKLLILLAEFGEEGDVDAPAHNMIARPGQMNNSDLWVEDFSTEHYGYGFLGVVDAHPKPIVAKGADIRTRLQNHDAAFSFERVEDKSLTLYGQTKVLQGDQADPEFNDSHSYWNPKAPSAGLKLPTYGLKVKVVGQSEDGTTAEIVLYK